MNITLWFRQDKKLVIETQTTQDNKTSYVFTWEALRHLGCFDEGNFREMCACNLSFDFHKHTGDRVGVGSIPAAQLPLGEKAS